MAEKTPRIDARLIRGLSEEQAAEFFQQWRGCSAIRDAVTRVLTNELESVTIQLESEQTLQAPNRDQIIADLLSFRRGIRLANKLLTDRTDNQ